MYAMRITAIHFVMKPYGQGEYLKADGPAISADFEKIIVKKIMIYLIF